jgi:RNA polymerase sigma-70 factor (ECF subfamily)
MWPDIQTTQDMLDEVRAGGAAAIDRLFDCHRDPLRRLVDLRLDAALARRVDASDVVQDVLLEASRRLAEYLRDPAMPFHLWLRQIAQDHMIDAHRRHRKAQRRSLDRERPLRAPRLPDQSSLDLAAQLLDRRQTPATAAVGREMAERLRQAVASLDDGDRDIITMRHFECLTNQDVALALGLTEAAASMRYLRALRRLKERLVEPTSN